MEEEIRIAKRELAQNIMDWVEGVEVGGKVVDYELLMAYLQGIIDNV